MVANNTGNLEEKLSHMYDLTKWANKERNFDNVMKYKKYIQRHQKKKATNVNLGEEFSEKYNGIFQTFKLIQNESCDSKIKGEYAFNFLNLKGKNMLNDTKFPDDYALNFNTVLSDSLKNNLTEGAYSIIGNTGKEEDCINNNMVKGPHSLNENIVLLNSLEYNTTLQENCLNLNILSEDFLDKNIVEGKNSLIGNFNARYL